MLLTFEQQLSNLSIKIFILYKFSNKDFIA